MTTATRTRKPAARKTHTATTGPKFDPYQAVTDAMVAQLEAGVAPWRQPWAATSGLPIRLSVGKVYRGVNVLLLNMSAMANGWTSPYWGTYDQIAEKGGQVRKGEKGTMIVFYKSYDDKTEVTAKGTPKQRFVLRTYKVFNTDQAEAAEGKTFRVPEVTVRTVAPLAEVDAAIAGYVAQVGSVNFGGNHAAYMPAADAIVCPLIEDHTTPEEFYSTLLHELGHSTGHASRLNREGVTTHTHFGSDLYAREELVAELTNAFASAVLGIGQGTQGNSAAYLANWASALRGDAKLVVQAAGQAQKAADLILGVSFEQTEAAEETAAA